IFTIPFGIAAARLAVYALWPFGRTVLLRPDRGVASVVGNIVWVVLAGWWLALAHLITGVAMILTIIGIPLGLANFKLIPIALTPFGREIVDIEEARRPGLTPEVVVSDQPQG
ncbi:MAG TPA: YccF domain-containing protein, partial [Acidimicrobiia bacterium]